MEFKEISPKKYWVDEIIALMAELQEYCTDKEFDNNIVPAKKLFENLCQEG